VRQTSEDTGTRTTQSLCARIWQGQHVTLSGLILAERILDVLFAQIIATGFSEHLQVPQAPSRQSSGNIDTLTIGSVGDGFASIGGDETGHPVFEIQCNLMAHGSGLTNGRCR